MPRSGPRAPLPAPLLANVPGTWAHDTMSRRVREEILARVFRENDLSAGAVAALRGLDGEIAADVELTALGDDGGPDVMVWNGILGAVRGGTWLSAPWVVSEFYLYRRIAAAVDWFGGGQDPFALQKELGLASAVESCGKLAGRVNAALEGEAGERAAIVTEFRSFVLTALWGNRMDLSLWPVGGDVSSGERAAESFGGVIEEGQRMILSNHADALCDYVAALPHAAPPRMDIIVDNAGFELFCDLALADFLVTSRLASVVHIQLKAHPTFVSDAMAKDVQYTIDFLRRSRSSDSTIPPPPIALLGDRWAEHVASGRWVLEENFFWVQPTAMWDMPEETERDLAQSSLVFVKGDANYRRLLGDRDWPLDTPFSDVACYFPAPVCALRTLKAELGCGMPREATERAAAEDENWLVAGKYGVVQFCDTRGHL